MMRRRFTLRVALVVIALLAFTFRFGPRIYRRAKFVDHYPHLSEKAAEWERRPNHAEGYSFQAQNGVWLMVSTSEHEVAKDYSTATYTGATPDPDRFFVVPPGKWVDTIDDVFATWDKYD